jgi:hypothetical protein
MAIDRKRPGGWSVCTTPLLRLATYEGAFTLMAFTRSEPLSKTRARQLFATRDVSVWVVFDTGRVSRATEGKITTFSLEELPPRSDFRKGTILEFCGITAGIQSGIAPSPVFWRSALAPSLVRHFGKSMILKGLVALTLAEPVFADMRFL